MNHDAFISYSSHDKTAADATCASLEASGIRCWIAPRDIAPGAEWGEAIIDAINGCRVMILIFSANANNSPQIRREVERAVNKGVAIIPLRIEDIAPARSLEYFIGSVHWLDAITPPLEAHLRRLADSVKALLRVDRPPPILGVAPGSAAVTAAPVGQPIAPPSARQPTRRSQNTILVAGLGVAVLGAGIWWFVGRPRAATDPVAVQATAAPLVAAPSEVRPPDAPSAAPAPSVVRPRVTPATTVPAPRPAPAAPPAASAPEAVALVDPAMVGTFAYSTLFNGYDMTFASTIAAAGTYHMGVAMRESGTYQAGNGMFRTVGKTGQVRTGSYAAAGGAAISVTSGGITIIYHPTDPATHVDPANPVMLGTWRGDAVQGGYNWVVTMRNNPNGTYSYEALAQDSGSCGYANQQWHATSVVTGHSDGGTYRFVDPRDVQLTGQAGSAVWRRR